MRLAEPGRNHAGTWPSLLALLTGLLHAASLAWPHDLTHPALVAVGLVPGQPGWVLQLLAMLTLALLLAQRPGHHTFERRAQARHAWRLGWLFGIGWLGGALHWIVISLHVYGGLAAPLAVLAVLVLAVALALPTALACWAFSALAPVQPAGGAMVFAACWTLAELLRGSLLGGFGWAAAGYAHVDGPLAAWAPWVGVYGMGALVAWLAMLLAQLLRGRPGSVWGLALLALVLLAPGLSERLRTPTHPMPALALTLLQGNIPQDEKFEPGSGVPLALRWYREQLLLVQQGLALAPETAIPLLPAQLPPDYLEPLQQHYAKGDRAALLGVPLGDSRSGYTNSAVALQAGKPWRYDKRHLLPFGEFIPTGLHWFTRALNIPLGDFRRGAAHQPALVWQGQRLAVNICYEDVFGEELATDFADPAHSPHVLVNLSNLGWFGDGVALDQHLHIARLRALEFERPLVLVTNTGISAVVDATGRVTHALPRGLRAVLPASVQGREGITPYAAWSAKLGLAPLALAALLVLGLAVRRRALQKP